MKKAIWTIGLCLLLISCSSKSPKGDSSETPAAPMVQGDSDVPPTDDTALTGEISNPTEKSASLEVNPDLPPPQTSKVTNDTTKQKYIALSQAVRAGKADAVRAELTKLLGQNANDATALNTVALYYYRSGQYGAAKVLLSRALEKNPNEAGLYTNLGAVALSEGEMTTAIANFKKALHIDPRNAESSANLGAIYATGGDYSRAMPLLETAYKANHGNSAIGNDYGLTLRVSKNYDQADKVYDEVIKANPRDANAHLNYAILLINYMNRPKDGLALVYKLKFLETDRKDVLARADALEKKAKGEIK